MAEELWQEIDGYNSRYYISSFGRVKNNDGLILKQKLNSSGYNFVSLSKNGVQKAKLVHRLVAIHFLKKKKGETDVNHKDGNKNNNHVDNLEWTTKRKNHLHKVYVLGKNTMLPKRVRCVETGKIYPSITIATSKVRLKNPICISNAVNGKRKTAGGFHWELVT